MLKIDEIDSPTEHREIRGHQSRALPPGSIVLRIDWPDGPVSLNRPMTRVKRESGIYWEDGSGQRPDLIPAARYLVLYVPTPPMAKVGERLARAHLDRLQPKAVVRDADGWVAQLSEHSVSGQRYWVGPLNEGAEWDDDMLWQSSGGVLELVALGLEESAEPETIGDGPEEWER